MKYCKTKTLVGININNKLKFDIHVGIIGQKTYRNLNALRKIANCMELPKNCILMNAFFYNIINYYGSATLMFYCFMAVS